LRERLAATGSSNGPDPAITTRRPRNDVPLFANACAPPTPMTPGRVQPGNGRNRSRAPVASTTDLATSWRRIPRDSATTTNRSPTRSTSTTDVERRMSAPLASSRAIHRRAARS
jgi:hypothetical protein